MDKLRLIRKIIQWLLLAVALLLLITGLGITEFRVMETISFGLLTKNVSHQIHTATGLWIFFLALLAAHISLSFIVRRKSRKN